MKIAYLINQYPKVSHSFIRREILALEARGFEVQRIALRGQHEPLADPEDTLERGRTRYVLRYGLWGLLPATLRAAVLSPLRFTAALGLAIRMAREGARPLPYHLAYVAEACCIVRWVKAYGARRIHAHFGTNSAEIVMLAHVLGGPQYSFTVHGPEEFLRPMGLEEKVRRASFVAAISSFGRSQLYCRSRHDDWPKIHIVHCGLEARFHAADAADAAPAAGTASAATPAGPPPRRLVCVGRLCEAKGQLLLLEAAARVAVGDGGFELVLAGDGPLRGRLEQLIQRYRLAGQVRITGWLSGAQVRAEILAARALVLPSFAEGLPVVLMEAMALRRPVLSTYVGGIPELVQHGVHGWLVAAGCVDELAGAMQHCLALAPQELHRLGEAAHARVIARHSIETEVAKLAEMFHMPPEAAATVRRGRT